jgi:coenzyme F420-reducing hydrogenase beta subunit
LSDSVGSFLCYDLDEEKRIKSASGGIVTAFLSSVLDKGLVNAVIAANSNTARYGEKFHEIAIFRTAEELENARNSKYYPMTYAEIFKTVLKTLDTYALVGLPCTMRAVRKLPGPIQERLKFTVSLFCSHNVTGQFLEYQARREKITAHEPFSANFRDKSGTPDARHFNSCFTLGETVRRDRFPFELWTNFSFAHEACLYCPDAYGAEADITAKDAWGSPCMSEQLGCSYIIVRNSRTLEILERLKKDGRIRFDPVSPDEIKSSQKGVVRFKHISVKHRLIFKRDIRTALKDRGYGYSVKDFFTVRPVLRYFGHLFALKLSRWQFALFPTLSLEWLTVLSTALRKLLEKKKR